MILLAIAPIALTILCGCVVARSGIVPAAQWGGIETLSFKVLIPAMLVSSIARLELSADALGAMLGAVILCLVGLGCGVLLLRGLFSQQALPNPDFTTLFQTTTRWNAFIALAAAELVAGPQALALIAAAMAAMIPLINIANIVVLARFGSADPSAGQVLRTIARNPLVLACALGILLNMTALPVPIAVWQALDLIGRAALGVGLLAVGAAIMPARLLRLSAPVVLGVALRVLVGPLLFLALAYVLTLSPQETLAGVLILGVPAASNGYVVARQMGGNAELYADILTWQTVLSLAMMPLLIPLAL